MSIDIKLPIRLTPAMAGIQTESDLGAPSTRGSNHPTVDLPGSPTTQLSPADSTRAARAAVGPGAPAVGAGGALQRPADQGALLTSTILKSRPNPSTTGADGPGYTAELEAFRAQLNQATRTASPVRCNGDASHWIGSALSTPSQIFATNALAISSVADSAWRWNLDTVQQGGAGIAAALLLPLTGLLAVFGKILWGASRLLDLPFTGLRALLSKAGSGEHEVARNEATHLRVAPGDWPELPTNAATNAAVRDYVANGRGYPYDVVVVPGYTTDHTEGPLSGRAKERLEQAARDLDRGLAPFIMVSGGNVHPPGTPFNEGFEMRRYLIDELGVSPDKIIVEPQADHSTTNLRNAGRYMHRFGLERALVTSSPQPFGQSFYFQSADGPVFGIHTRCMRNLGTRLGSLTRVDNSHTAFTPSAAVDLVSLAGGEVPPSDP